MIRIGRYCLSLLLLLVVATPLQAQSVSERLQSLGGLLRSSPQQDFLHPDQAFVVSATRVEARRLVFEVAIADGYYLYHDQFGFSVIEGDARIAPGSYVIPDGKIKEDPSFGQVEVNVGIFDVEVPVIRNSRSETPVTVQMAYQGCKDESLCYPPIKKTVALILPAYTDEPTPVSPVAGQTSGSPVAEPEQMISEQDGFTRRLAGEGLLINMLIFLGAGLLLSLTPCVFPMIPILSGIIMGQERRITAGWGFTLSLVYVLAMALTYAAAGVLAAMLGVNIQAAAQNVWVLSLFSAIFVALALSMFGFYEIQMPAALQTRLTRLSNSRQGGTLTGVAIMGAVSAIIVGPCVAPPLVGALAYISQTGDELLGGLALFAMGLGMGVPLLVLGGSAGTLLPRAGRWMDTVKRIFGVGLLGLAIWFMARVIPAPVELLLWGALLMVCAIYMGALDRSEPGNGWSRLWQGVGLILLLWGALLIIGGSAGGTNVYQPLRGLTAGSSGGASEHEGLAFQRIKTVADLDRELATAAGRPVMLDFYADWCIECIRMESSTFPDPAVRTVLSDVVLLQADVTANDEADKALLSRFGIYGPPAILFFGSDAAERPAYRLYGYVPPDRFTEHVRQATRVGS